MAANIVGKSFICFLVLLQIATGQNTDNRLDSNQIHRFSSRRIIVEFQSELATDISLRLRQINTSLKSKMIRPDMIEDSISRKLSTAMNSWRVSAIRPLYSFKFKNPELATKYGLNRFFVLEVPEGSDIQSMASNFLTHQEVVSASVDPIVTPAMSSVAASSNSEPDFDKQWNMHNTGQTGGTVNADIDALEAWEVHTGLTGDVIIAFVDSGVDIDPYNNLTPHPEFVGKFVPGINTVPGEPDDATGDDCNHGTLLAGIATAPGNNGIGIAGVSWGAKIMPIDVLQGCYGYLTDTISGIIWAADHDADVINIGLQFFVVSSGDLTLLENAMSYAFDQEAILICAAGVNSGNVIAFPGRLDRCLAVSATDDNDELAPFSSYGDELDLAAPGESIYSTTRGGNYGWNNGTGIASAHVSGIAALMKSLVPNATNVNIIHALIESADDLGTPGWDDHFGYGRVNAYKALIEISNPTTGACCNIRLGTCEITPQEECQGENVVWTKGSACSEQTCPDPFVPTVSQWGLVILTLLLMITAKIAFGGFQPLKIDS